MRLFHIFHKWPKWSKPVAFKYDQYLAIVPGTWSSSEEPVRVVTRWKQERICEVCGLYERRLIKPSGASE